ncbi:MAG: serine--tRNA ligase [Candidatus Margulisbacteria bacterium]|nr:serine--tRNA ligase [Candidatus Margulisiibacteriota bacterium]
MLAPKFIRENTDFVKDCLQKRNYGLDILDEWLSIDKEYRDVLQKTENLKAERNQFKPQGKPDQTMLQKMKTLSEAIKENDEKVKELEEKLNGKALYLPNIISADTPVGDSEKNNVEVKKYGQPKSFTFKPKGHDELGKELDILDFQRGAKLSGSRFTVYKGWGAKLERALVNFMLETHGRRGYQEVLTPYLVSAETMTGTGQLPKFEEELYKCERDGLYLIPTAEVSVTNIYRDEILEEAELPKKFVSFSPCFRREAGSYGKDITGLIRQHQFNKVELVMYSKPEKSAEMLEVLTGDAERILELLDLPYRRIQLCSSDLGFSSSKTYDLEVWFPSAETYREISSCSNFLDFQARRAKIRYRTQDKKVEHIHTLNGSGLAIGRTVAAIMENYQQPDGTIKVPSMLQDYLKIEIIK